MSPDQRRLRRAISPDPFAAGLVTGINLLERERDGGEKVVVSWSWGCSIAGRDR